MQQKSEALEGADTYGDEGRKLSPPITGLYTPSIKLKCRIEGAESTNFFLSILTRVHGRIEKIGLPIMRSLEDRDSPAHFHLRQIMTYVMFYRLKIM
jgi:hypothetical protein